MLDLLTLAAETGATPEDIAFFSVAGLIALLTLTSLEVVLGIDNVVFITILAGKLPEEKQAKARTLGLLLAMVMRLILLGAAYWVVTLLTPLFHLPWPTETITNDAGETLTRGIGISGKDLLLLLGGLFLIAKATWEIHHMVEDGGAHAHDPEVRPGMARKAVSFASVITQILLLDLVFSIDSVITAVGMTSNYWIMATAVVIAIAVMLAFAGPIGRFVNKHPTMKTLALAFLILIGVLLVADGLHQHLDRGYIYFAMGFALAVELVNVKAGARRKKKAAAVKAP
ncbi:MAG: membrane protein [Phycisphaeraceae bacterium]|nr:MAG: membrane protein [Phycisphaeraceae bacterium]